jgi:hypothetical protein
MTKTKKQTPAAIALFNAVRSGVPGAVSAAIDEITKDAPPMPGLAELEAEYGAGKVPMTAVLGSTLLSLKDKKWLFKIAGYEYPTEAVEDDTDEQYHTFYKATPESYESLMMHDTIGALAGQAFGGSEKQFANRVEVRKWGLAELPDFQLSAKQVKEAVEAAAELRSRLTMVFPRG